MSDAATEQSGAFCSVHKPTIWDRMGFRRRFDESLFDWRNNPLDGFVESAITTHVSIYVSLWDRLRLLLTGHAELIAYTRTNVMVDHAVTRSEFTILPPIPRRERPRGNA